MEIRINSPKSRRASAAVVAAALSLAVWARPAAAQEDAPVVVTAPAAWSTLRSDSVVVSIQADTSRLPGGVVNFKVVKRSGAKSSTLFSKSVGVREASVDAFLGRAGGLPVGGREYLSIEWSVPGSELSGVVEPVGVVRLNGAVSAENKWVPAAKRVEAVRLKDGVTAEGAAEALAGSGGFVVGGAKFAAGWNGSGLFLYFPQAGSVSAAEFAFDLKCGSNAFVAWADRFVRVSADTAYGLHVSKRSVDKDGLAAEESRWGSAGSIALTKSGGARVVSVEWSELGIQPFDGRNIGFAVFVAGGGGKGVPFTPSAAYPSGAARLIPGTWGGLELGK